MRYLKLVIGIAALLLVLATAFVYYYKFAGPDEIPSKAYLKQGVNQALPEAKAAKVQDRVKVDERHLFVPFINQEGFYALSTWEWKNHKWRVSFVDTDGEPRVWRIDKNEPQSYRLIWNINPHDQVKYMDLYLMRKRNFVVSGGVGAYYPKVQMKHRVYISKKPYDATRLPSDWQQVMANLGQIGQDNQKQILGNQNLYMGWMSFNNSDEIARPNSPTNGYGFGNGHESIDYVMPLDKMDLEN